MYPFQKGAIMATYQEIVDAAAARDVAYAEYIADCEVIRNAVFMELSTILEVIVPKIHLRYL